MRKFFLNLLLVGFGLYLILNLTLGSRPVQQKVLSELRNQLREFGIELDMESIEFSTFSAKIYLNRVRLTTTPKSGLKDLPPLSIDKVKLQFQPLALIYKKLSIEELLFFHPKITQLQYTTIKENIDIIKKKWKGGSSSNLAVDIDVKKIGVIDAWLEIDFAEKIGKFRSQGISIIYTKEKKDEFRLEADSKDLVWLRSPLNLAFSKVDLAVMVSPKRISISKLEANSNYFNIAVSSQMSMPKNLSTLPADLTAKLDIDVDANLFSQFPQDFKLKDAQGKVHWICKITSKKSDLQGEGTLSYKNLSFGGYQVGTGQTKVDILKDQIKISGANFLYAGGEVKTTKPITLSLNSPYNIQGQLGVKNVRLEKILEGVKLDEPYIRLGFSGSALVEGQLNPFQIQLKPEIESEEIKVVDELDKQKPVVVNAGNGKILGTLTFTEEKLLLQNELQILDGTVNATGHVGFKDDTVKLNIQGKNISLTKLGKIVELRFAGETDINAELEVKDEKVKIAGVFDAQKGEIADIYLGKISGQAYFDDLVLSFEDLRLHSIEAAQGRGLVDFRPKTTRYEFTADAKRFSIDDVFRSLEKLNLPFEKPHQGELSAKFKISNMNSPNFTISATGLSKDFQWYNEYWKRGAFSLDYTLDDFTLNQLLLEKKSSTLAVSGFFRKSGSLLKFSSPKIDLQELNRFEHSEFKGNLSGEVAFDGKGKNLFDRGTGTAYLESTSYKGVSISNSEIKLSKTPDNTGTEITANLAGNTLLANYKYDSSPALNLSFRRFDLIPWISILHSNPVHSISFLRVTGNGKFQGELTSLDDLSGSSIFQNIEVGFKSSQLRLTKPANFSVQKGSFSLPSFNLQGSENYVNGQMEYKKNHVLKGNIDGNVDLQMIEPFIPGLEQATGRVSLGGKIEGTLEKFQFLGSALLSDGAFKVQGIPTDFRSVSSRLAISQDTLSIEKLEGSAGDGKIKMNGNIHLHSFRTFEPKVFIQLEKVSLPWTDTLRTTLSGNFSIVGTTPPYALSGQCQLDEGLLTQLAQNPNTSTQEPPKLLLDIQCSIPNTLKVESDILQTTFTGKLHAKGTEQKPILLGSIESYKGYVFFRNTQFTLNSANINFEDPKETTPRFNVNGNALVKEQKNVGAQNYEVTLQALGVPQNYKIRLTSNPTLTEQEIISLLLLGVPNRAEGGNYADIGSTLAGQIPIQSKIQSQLGLKVKVGNQPTNPQAAQTTTGVGVSSTTVPTVEIQKGITDKTRLSLSNTLETVPVRELRIEQILNDNLTLNATTKTSPGAGQIQPSQSYGFDLRYRFQFE